MSRFFIFLCITGFSIPVFAQKDTVSIDKKKLYWQNLKYDVHTMGGGFVNAFTQPLRWKKDDYMIAGAAVAGVSLLYLVDEETGEFFKRQRNDIPEGVLYGGWLFGKPQVSYGLTAGIYVFGLFTDNEKIREAGVLLGASAAATGIFQQTMKTVTGRARPSVGRGKDHYRLFRGGHAYGSFPSGHTILSTTMIYGLSKQFSNPWVKAGLYTVGLITPMNRLVEGAHWLTDVVLSVVVSVAMVEGVDNYLKRNKKYGYADDDLGLEMIRQNKNKIKWNLSFSGNQIGVTGTF